MTSPQPPPLSRDAFAAADRSDWAAFIRSAAAVAAPPLTPELRFYGATDYSEIWAASEETLNQAELPPPFWAFAWAGGQALARFILDDPARVRGRRVLSIGAGAALEAIAAARVGATRSIANDIDPLALAAAALNAELNGVALELDGADRLDAPPPDSVDLVLLGDAFYEHALSARLDAFAARAAEAGCEVWIAGPDRPHPSRLTIERLAEYDVPVPAALEDVSRRRARVGRLRPQAPMDAAMLRPKSAQ